MRERLYTKFRFLSFAAIAAVALSCAPQADKENLAASGSVTGSGLRGMTLAEPLAKPSFVLTRVDGRSYDFAQETAGKITLLFFGYTHCPDVCPLHMANIAAVLKKMPWSTRDAFRVVFVTTDPERDTPARLTEWLGGFDPSFVGLYGPRPLVDSAQRSLGIAPAVRQEPPPGDTAEYLVGHAAQVFVFGRDNMARMAYPFGTRQEDWAHDLPRLVNESAQADAHTAGNHAGNHQMPPSNSLGSPRSSLAIAPPVIAVSADGRSGAMYLNIQNHSNQADTLRAVSVIAGALASLHGTATRNGSSSMQALPSVEIPASGRLEMRPGAVHVMLESAPEPMRPGSAAAVELFFARRGRVTAIASIVSYAQLDSVLALARTSLTR
jgi:cytochrome oxidase Cu insertion factor (SCO1/SenC/PrrC family)/copper(I)-binding protein